jgi:hypothetical protein
MLESALRSRYHGRMNRLGIRLISVVLVAGAQAALATQASADPHDGLIAKHAAANGVPESLVRRIIHIESRGNPRAVSKGNYGLMQIRLGTARALGYSGSAQGLLDADTNMTYAVRYLASAYRAAGCNISRAVAYYQRGFYKKPQTRCSATASAGNRIVEARTDATGTASATSYQEQSSGETTRTKPAAHPADVLKPRVVPIEKITSSQQTLTTKGPIAKFDPLRITPPPLQTTVATLEPSQGATPPSADTRTLATSVQPIPRPRPASLAKLDAAASASQRTASPVPTQSTESLQVAALDMQSVPLPPVRPEIDTAISVPAKASHRAAHRHARRIAAKKPPEASGLAAFMQKFSAPEKKTRHRSNRTAAPYAAPVY